MVGARDLGELARVHREARDNDNEVLAPEVVRHALIHVWQLASAGPQKRRELFWGAGSWLLHVLRLHRDSLSTQRIGGFWRTLSDEHGVDSAWRRARRGAL